MWPLAAQIYSISHLDEESLVFASAPFAFVCAWKAERSFCPSKNVEFLQGKIYYSIWKVTRCQNRLTKYGRSPLSSWTGLQKVGGVHVIWLWNVVGVHACIPLTLRSLSGTPISIRDVRINVILQWFYEAGGLMLWSRNVGLLYLKQWGIHGNCHACTWYPRLPFHTGQSMHMPRYWLNLVCFKHQVFLKRHWLRLFFS